MKCIIAQGNPGKDYADTRHNIAWRCLEAFAEKQGTSFIQRAKFAADIAECQLGGQKILLVKPTTFYNETGRSARALVDFYKLDATRDVLVIHDELALNFGRLRVRRSGSDAGNNGIKSLNATIGSQYARLRIGIASDLRARMGDSQFVLSRFSATERQLLVDCIIPQILTLTETFIDGELADDSISCLPPAVA